MSMTHRLTTLAQPVVFILETNAINESFRNEWALPSLRPRLGLGHEETIS